MGLSPARGWSADGSGSEAGERKEVTSVAVLGSKGAEAKVVFDAGSVRLVVVEEDEDGDEWAGVRFPVRVSQKDMAIPKRTRTDEWEGELWNSLGNGGKFEPRTPW